MEFWIQTYTGKRFDFDTEEAQDINIMDLSRSLSRIPRFNGHTVMPLSVAEHSHAVMEIVAVEGGSEKQQLAALLHDAHEAFTGDPTSPLKAFLLKRYSVDIGGLQTVVQRSIERSLGVEPLEASERALIRKADAMALLIERRRHMAGDMPWPGLAGIEAPVEYEGFYGNWGEDEAMLYFERAFDRLKKSVDFEERIAKEESAVILE